MGNPTSYFYYSDNAGSETWTQERFIELKAIDSINSRCRMLELIIIDTNNLKVSNFFEYQRVKIVEKTTGDDNIIFLGRIEQILPSWDSSYGQVIKLTARDYMQEFTERAMESNLSTPKVRSAHIADIITNYTYAGNITTNIETSGSDALITRDLTGSQISPLELIEQFASEDPWTNTTWDSPDGAVWRWDNSGTTWVDNTVEADSAAGTPFSMFDATVDYIYFGRNNPFAGLIFDLAVNGLYGTQTWQYWNGSSWATLTPTQLYDFTADGTIQWDVPTNWTSLAFSAGTPHSGAPPNATSRYWVRASVSSITTEATVNSVTILAGNGYDYYVDDAQVFQYFRRGSKPAGGPLTNGLTVELMGTLGDQTKPMFVDYSFFTIPQETVTRITVKGIDADGVDVSATEINTALETQLKIVKEYKDFIYGATTEAACETRAKAIMSQKGTSVIKRGNVKIMSFPYFYKSAAYTVVRAGDLIRVKCSTQSVDEDMLVLEVVYKEPLSMCEIVLLGNAWGRGFATIELSSVMKKLKEGLSIGMARIGDLVVNNARINSLDAGKITTGTLQASTAVTVAGEIKTSATTSRISIVPTGIKGYNSGNQRFALNSDGSGWMGSSGSFSWTTAGVVSIDSAAITSLSVTKLTAGTLSVAALVGAGGAIRSAASGTRIELTNTHIAGYNGTTLQFELRASDGKVYAGGGNVIISSTGINIFGLNNALTTRATVSGTIQCYVGSDGILYAGAGAVRLSSTGIRITGDNIMQFYYSTTKVGRIYIASGYLGIWGETNTQMDFVHTGSSGNVNISAGTAVYLANSGTTIIGCNVTGAYINSGKQFQLPSTAGTNVRNIWVSGNSLVYKDSSNVTRTLTGT